MASFGSLKPNTFAAVLFKITLRSWLVSLPGGKSLSKFLPANNDNLYPGMNFSSIPKSRQRFSALEDCSLKDEDPPTSPPGTEVDVVTNSTPAIEPRSFTKDVT